MRTLRIAALSTFLFAGAAAAGPPWISVEYPANPHERTTRGALFLVHAFHHGTSIDVPLQARFEGLVDGERRTIEATIEATHRRGVFAVRGAVPMQGSWVAVVGLTDEQSPADALVTLGANGTVFAVEVPTDRDREGWYIPRTVEEQDIVRALHAAARLAHSGVLDAPAVAAEPVDVRWAGALGVLLVFAGAAGLGRLRGSRHD